MSCIIESLNDSYLTVDDIHKIVYFSGTFYSSGLMFGSFSYSYDDFYIKYVKEQLYRKFSKISIECRWAEISDTTLIIIKSDPLKVFQKIFPYAANFTVQEQVFCSDCSVEDILLKIYEIAREINKQFELDIEISRIK